MGSSTRASLFSTFVLLSSIVSQVQCYAIDQSCAPYATDGIDKTAMVSAAMVEAQSMATLARDQITQPFDMFDDSKLLLFPLATDADFLEVKGYYQTLLSAIPWTITDEHSLILDRVTIYCGDANFVAYNTDNAAGSSWMDLTSSHIFTGPAHGGQSGTGLCTSGIAQTLNHGHLETPTSTAGESDIQVLILCDAALVRGSAFDTTESRASLQEIYNAGELFAGRAITNIGYQHALSWTVLHELFHAALTDTMAKGSDEIYGWDMCTSYSGLAQVATITTAQSKINCDTLAYYGMVLKVEDIDNDLFFMAGFLGSRNAATQAMTNNWQQQQQQPIWGNP